QVAADVAQEGADLADDLVVLLDPGDGVVDAALYHAGRPGHRVADRLHRACRGVADHGDDTAGVLAGRFGDVGQDRVGGLVGVGHRSGQDVRTVGHGAGDGMHG